MIMGTSGRISLAFGSISRPVMPGMLMSDRINIMVCSIGSAIRDRASAAESDEVHDEALRSRSRRN